MVVASRCFAFRALITQARIWKSFQVQNSTSLQNKNWLRVQDFVDKTLRVVRISLLITAIQRVLRFSSGNLFYKSNRKLFSCVCIAWYKHSRRWENSRQLCKPSTSSRVCITVSNSPNPSRVYIRLCKHGKRFLLLNWHTDVHPKPLPLSTRYFGTGLPILKEDPHFKKKDLITLNITFIWHRGYMIVAYRYPLWVKRRVPSYTESQFNIWHRCS